MTWILFILCLAVPQQQGPRQGRGRGPGRDQGDGRASGPAIDAIVKLQERILRAPEPTVEDFEELSRASFRLFRERHLHPAYEDPDATKSEEQIAFRRDVYGPIYDDSRGRKLMRSIVEAPQPDEWKATAVASVFADHAGDDDIRSVFAGLQYIAADGAASFSSLAENYGRHLGRMLATPPKPEADAALRDSIRADLKAWLQDATGRPIMRAAALQAFFEGGDLDIVSQWFEKVLGEHVAEPCEVLRLLPGSLRLLQHPRFSATTRDRLRAEADKAIAAFLADPPPRTTLTASQEPVRCLRGAVRVLLPKVKDGELEPILGLFVGRYSGLWLGIDMLQEVRWELQRARTALADAAKAELDRALLKVIIEDGSVLREETIGEDAKSAFLDRRDLRYNAAGYLLEAIGKDGALVERVSDHPEALDVFMRLVNSGLDAEARKGVREKTETAVTLCELLGKLRADFEEEIDREGLKRLLLAQLRAEVGDANRDAEHEAAAPVMIAVKKKPADAWVKDHCIDALKALGCTVTEGGESLTVE